MQVSELLRGFLGLISGWAVTLGLAALGFYLLSNHTGHILLAVPYLVLLACPLMHLFGHHHGYHGRGGNKEKPQ